LVDFGGGACFVRKKLGPGAADFASRLGGRREVRALWIFHLEPSRLRIFTFTTTTTNNDLDDDDDDNKWMRWIEETRSTILGLLIVFDSHVLSSVIMKLCQKIDWFMKPLNAVQSSLCYQLYCWHAGSLLIRDIWSLTTRVMGLRLMLILLGLWVYKISWKF